MLTRSANRDGNLPAQADKKPAPVEMGAVWSYGPEISSNQPQGPVTRIPIANKQDRTPGLQIHRAGNISDRSNQAQAAKKAGNSPLFSLPGPARPTPSSTTYRRFRKAAGGGFREVRFAGCPGIELAP